MKNPFFKLSVLALSATALLGVVQTQAAVVTNATMEILADNDFALFVGNSTSVDRLVYQNNVIWYSQAAALTSFSFSLNPGEDTFYLLGMGGGLQENISGLINGVDITSVGASQSSNLSSYLTGFNSTDVTSGAYNASLANVQTALPNLTWGSPNYNTTDTVIGYSPNHEGYDFPSDTAVLFKFGAATVNIAPTPEPASLALSLLGSAGLILFRRRK